MSAVSEYGIAVFHNLGDVLSCTPVARQIKASDPGCRITWFTSEGGARVLDNNPFVDEVVPLPGVPAELDALIPRLRDERPWTRFLTPAAYFNFDVLPGGSVFDLVRHGARLHWFVPFAFTMRLSADEVREARSYWSRLPPGPKVLVESQFYSAQSPWTDECAFDLLEAFAGLDPVFVFTASKEPPFLERFTDAWPKTVWCQEPFRLNAELYNLCDAFVGVSSGISALAHSDHCRKDVPHVELSNGEKWGAAVLPEPEELFVCYSRSRYREALATVAARLSGRPARPDFSPRFQRTRGVLSCPACGSSHARPARKGEQEFVQCERCELIHSKREELQRADELLPPERRARRRDAAGNSLSGCGGLAAGASVLEISSSRTEPPEVARVRSMSWTAMSPGEFVAADPSESTFDVVLATHVLQRIEHPIEFLEKVEYVLRPGGFFFCNFPNWSGLGSIALQDDWPGLERGHARCQLTIPALRPYLIQAGFYLEAGFTDEGEGGLEPAFAALSRLVPTASRATAPELLEGVHLSGVGEEAHVVCRKRGRSKARVRA